MLLVHSIVFVEGRLDSQTFKKWICARGVYAHFYPQVLSPTLWRAPTGSRSGSVSPTKQM